MQHNDDKEECIEHYNTVISTGRGPVAAHIGVFKTKDGSTYPDVIQTGETAKGSKQAWRWAKAWSEADKIPLKGGGHEKS